MSVDVFGRDLFGESLTNLLLLAYSRNVIHHASRTIDASPAVKLVKQTGSQAITKVNNLSVNAAELTLSGLQATQYVSLLLPPSLNTLLSR